MSSLSDDSLVIEIRETTETTINRNNHHHARSTQQRNAGNDDAVEIRSQWVERIASCSKFWAPHGVGIEMKVSWKEFDDLSDLALWVLQGLFGVLPLKHMKGKTPKASSEKQTGNPHVRDKQATVGPVIMSSQDITQQSSLMTRVFITNRWGRAIITN